MARGLAPFALLLLAAAATPASADETVLVWAVSRHSIKSVNYTRDQWALSEEVKFAPPTSAPEHDSDALTEHGKAYARQVGRHYREVYGKMFPAGMACADIAQQLTMWADTDVRDVASAELFLAGFAEGCEGTVGWVVADAWTHEVMEEEPHGYAGCGYATEEDVALLYGGDVAQWLETNLADELATLTQYLAPKTGRFKPSGEGCPEDPAVPCTFASMRETWVGPGKWKTYANGWNRAGQLAVTLLQQYLNNMPYSDDLEQYVPRVPPQELARLYHVGDLNFGVYKNPINGRLFGNNVQAQLLRDIRDAVAAHQSGRCSEGCAGRFKYLMAHDVNVQWLADALRLALNTPGWRSGTSSIFMGAIILEVTARPAAAGASDAAPALEYAVTAYQQASTMQQIRALGGMVRSPLPLPCSNPRRCPLDEFVEALAGAIYPKCVAEGFREEVVAAKRGGFSAVAAPSTEQDARNPAAAAA